MGRKRPEPALTAERSNGSTANGHARRFCAQREMPVREFATDVNAERAGLLRSQVDKWVNGTELRYYFFTSKDNDGENVLLSDGSKEWRTWVGPESERRVVREAFKIWEDVGIGLTFTEVKERSEAEMRIGFMQEDGSWSYIGRGILDAGPDERTMNIGWKIAGSADGLDTAVHEIGHSIGFPHEHQNPVAGIVWDEEAVYADLGGPPNNWSRDKTHFNIIRKLAKEAVRGSVWDPNSVMHYPFGPGLIKEPVGYQHGLVPAGGLSALDKQWAKQFFPPIKPATLRLEPHRSIPLALANGEQADFVIKPAETRYYDMATFGESDAVMVLFEVEGGSARYRTADDDGGEPRNATIRMKLIKDREYVLRVRVYYSKKQNNVAVMLW